MKTKEDIRKYIKTCFLNSKNVKDIMDVFTDITTILNEEFLLSLENKTTNHCEEFDKMALEKDGEVIKLEPGNNQYLNVFNLNNSTEPTKSNMTKNTKNLNEQRKFEKLVKTLAELSYYGKYNDEIYDFEEAVHLICEAEDLEGPYFGIARSNWSRIDFDYTPNYCPAKFYAEYDDGNQAPFIVCEWNDEFEKLENLLKEISEELYQEYQTRLGDKYF